MQAADKRAEPLLAIFLSQSGELQMLGQVLSHLVAFDRLGQSHEYAVEDLARRLASKRDGQDVVGALAGGDEPQVTMREPESLAGPGRCADHEMRKTGSWRHQSSSSSSSPVAGSIALAN